MTTVRESIYEERLKLCTLMDKCNGCQLPPNPGNVPGFTTIRHNWCMANCEVPGQMQAQVKTIENLQREDREARGVKPANGESDLFLENCK